MGWTLSFDMMNTYLNICILLLCGSCPTKLGCVSHYTSTFTNLTKLCTSFVPILTPLVLPSSVPSSYFIFAVPMHKYWGDTHA